MFFFNLSKIETNNQLLNLRAKLRMYSSPMLYRCTPYLRQDPVDLFNCTMHCQIGAEESLCFPIDVVIFTKVVVSRILLRGEVADIGAFRMQRVFRPAHI